MIMFLSLLWAFPEKQAQEALSQLSPSPRACSFLSIFGMNSKRMALFKCTSWSSGGHATFTNASLLQKNPTKKKF